MEIPESLPALLQAISKDAGLRERLLSLENVSPEIRELALQGIARQMHAAREDAATAEAISLLARPHFFKAACQTLREFAK